MQPRQTGSDAFVGKLLYRKHVAPLYYCILITVFLLIGLKMTILGRRKKTISALWAERPGAPRVARAGTRRAPVLDARRALGRQSFLRTKLVPERPKNLTFIPMCTRMENKFSVDFDPSFPKQESPLGI